MTSVFGQLVKFEKLGEYGSGPYQDVFVQENLAYCTAGGAGLDILDISNILEPKRLSNFNASGEFRDIVVDDGFAYVVDWIDGLVILDVSDPHDPVFVGNINQLQQPPSCISIGNGFLYLVQNNIGLRVYNVRDPSHPVNVGNLLFDELFAPQKGIAANGSLVFMTCVGRGLMVVDVSVPEDPILIGETPLGEGYESIAVRGNFAYVADSNFGLYIVDVSNPYKPIVRGHLDMDIGFGHPIGTLALDGKRVYLPVPQGMEIVDVSNPQMPVSLGTYSGDQRPFRIFPKGPHAFFASGANGLRILDVSHPKKTREIASFDQSSTEGHHVFVHHNHAFLFRFSRMDIYDISQPTQAVEVAESSGGISTIHGVSANDLAYVVVRNPTGVGVLDVSHPDNPVVLGSELSHEFGRGNSIVVEDRFAYVASPFYGDLQSRLVVFDISDPQSPRVTGDLIHFGQYFWDVKCIDADRLAVQLFVHGMAVLDIRNPHSPELLGEFTLNDGIYSFDVNGTYAYVGDRYGLNVLELSDPQFPRLLASMPLGTRIMDVFFHEDFAYLAADDGRLIAVDVMVPDAPQIAGTYPTRDRLASVHVTGNLVTATDSYSGKLFLFEASVGSRDLDKDPISGRK